MTRTINRRKFLAGSAGLAAGTATVGNHAALAQSTPMAGGTPDAGPMVAPASDTAISGRIRYQIVPSGPNDVNVLQDFFNTTFRETYADLEVVIEPAPSGSGDPLLASMVAGDAPDIIDTWTSRATPYIDADQILDLKPLVDRDFSADALADFYPWVLEAQTLESGLQWGMPRYVNITVLWYNASMLEEAGISAPDESWNQDTYRDAILGLTQKQGDRTRVYGGHIPAFAYGRFANKVEAWGGSVVDPADNTLATFDSAEGQAAAEWHRQLMIDEKAITDLQFLTTGGGSEGVAGALANFGAGRIATLEEGFYPFAYADAIGENFPFAVAAPPSGPAGRPVLGSADGFSIWSGSHNQEAAWEVVKFASGPAFQRALIGLTGYLPVRRSVVPEYLQIVTEARPQLAEANLQVGLDLLETGDPHERPLFAKDAEAEQIINAGLERIFVVGDTPVEYLEELADQVTEAMRA